MTTRNIDGHEVEVSNLDKVLFPDAGITKGDLIDHVAELAELILTYTATRPVALKRYPDGIDEPGFFQKSRPEGAPDWLGAVDVPLRQGGTKTHVTVPSAAALVYLANLATIELHRWLSCADDLETPDQLVFDLDPPPGTEVADIRWAARRVRELFDDELGLQTVIKTSGSRGFHVHVPLARSVDFDGARAFADAVAGLLASRHPARLTTAARKADRGARIYLDVGRNAYGQTAVSAYSLRARPGAPVATPIAWEELSDVTPQRYTIGNIRRRLGQKSDPWSGAFQAGADLADASRALDELRREHAG